MIYRYVLSLAVFLLSMQWSFGGGLTSGRLGILLLLILMLLAKHPGKIIPAVIVVPVFVIVIYGITISLLFGPVDGAFYRVFIWVLYSFMIVFIYNAFLAVGGDGYRHMAWTLYSVCLALLSFCVLMLISKLGPLFFMQPPYLIRNTVNEMPGGLSSYFFGVYSVFALGLICSIVSKSYRLVKLYCLVLVLIVVLTASRQFLVYGVSSIFIVLVFGFFSNKIKLLSLKTIVFVCMFGVALVAATNVDFVSAYLDRVLSFEDGYTVENDSAGARLGLIVDGFNAFLDNPYGYGANAHSDVLGRPPHNGYIGVALDYGLIGLISYIALGCAVIFRAYTCRTDWFGVFVAVFVPFYFITPFFNDVVYIAIYWVVVSAAYGIVSHSKVSVQ